MQLKKVEITEKKASTGPAEPTWTPIQADLSKLEKAEIRDDDFGFTPEWTPPAVDLAKIEELHKKKEGKYEQKVFFSSRPWWSSCTRDLLFARASASLHTPWFGAGVSCPRGVFLP